MANANPTDPRNFVPPAHEDARRQKAVLTFVLAEHPALLTVPEVVHELICGPDGFTDRDAVCRAVHDLTAAGLLLQRADFLSVTRAALHFAQLETAWGDRTPSFRGQC